MVSTGTVGSPARRVSAAASSGVVTVRSTYGMPREFSRLRPLLQGEQSLPVYSVTGNWLATRRSSKGRAALPAAAGAGLPAVPVTGRACAAGGGWSEKLTRPSGPTIR